MCHFLPAPPPPSHRQGTPWKQLPDKGLKRAKQKFKKWTVAWNSHHQQRRAQSSSSTVKQTCSREGIQREVLSKKDQVAALQWNRKLEGDDEGAVPSNSSR